MISPIYDPVRAAGTTLLYTEFAYTANGVLSGITEPGPNNSQGGGRTTAIVVNSTDSTLRQFTDTATVTTLFRYDASLRLALAITPRPDTTHFKYNATTWKLDSTYSPLFKKYPSGAYATDTVRLRSSFQSWEVASLPTTSTTPANAQYVAARSDTIRALIKEPGGQVRRRVARRDWNGGISGACAHGPWCRLRLNGVPGEAMTKAGSDGCRGTRVGTMQPYSPTAANMAPPPGGTGMVAVRSYMAVKGSEADAPIEGEVDSIVVTPKVVEMRVGERRPSYSMVTYVGFKNGAPVSFRRYQQVITTTVARLNQGFVEALSAEVTDVEVGQMVMGAQPTMGRFVARYQIKVIP